MVKIIINQFFDSNCHNKLKLFVWGFYMYIFIELNLLAGQVFLNVTNSQVFQSFFTGFTQSSLFSDSLQEWLLSGSNVFQEFQFKIGDIAWLDFVQMTSDTAEDASNLFSNIHWAVLSLFQQFSQSNTSVQQLLGGGIHIGTELGESSDFSILSQIKFHGTGNLFHGFQLSGGTDSRDGQTDVDSWSDTFVEQLSFQENLTVSDGDDIGWDIGGDITSLGFDNWEGGHRTSAHIVGHFSGSFQQSRVQVEDITWVGFSSWWSSEKEGHLSVGDGLFGQIVVHDQSVSSVISEPFSHGASRVWSQVLKWGGVGGGGDNNNTVFQAISFFQNVDQLTDSRLFLADGDVDAVQFFGFITFVVESFLVQDGVQSDGGFSGLSITDDQFSLASTDWDQRVDGFQTRLHWFVDGFSGDNTWGFDVDSSSFFGVDWSFTVNGVSEWIDNSTEEFWSDWDVDDGTGSSYDVTFFNFSIVTEDDNTDVVWLQVQSHTFDSGVKFNHFFGLDVFQTVNSSNTITNSQYLTGFLKIDLGGFAGDSLFQEVGEFSGALFVSSDG